MFNDRARWIPLPGGAASSVLALALLSGCGEYTSDYRPPQDGRARVLWNDKGVFAAVPQGAVSRECLAAMDDAMERPDAYFRGYSPVRSGVRVYWVPSVIVGPPVPVIHHASGPLHPIRHAATPTASGGGSFFGSGGSGGSGGGGDSGKAIAVVAAVVVLLALPAVTLGLAAGRPEPEKSVALAIDEVNAYNDLARYPGTPCSPEVTGGPR
ncbi:MAG: hypothetical protein U0359_03650 [Byssovorax sp.]